MIKNFIRLFLFIVIITLGIFITKYLIEHKPKPKRKIEHIKPLLVETIKVKPITETIKVNIMGTVIPAKEVILQPQVSGRIIELHPDFEIGSFIKKGEVIARIDPKDYELALERSEFSLDQAKAELELELGRQEIAKKEWEQFNENNDVAASSKELALRKPQLAKAESAVKTAYNNKEQAKLNLERTWLKVPFNCFVKNENVEMGQLVSPQSQISDLVGYDELWVQASIPVEYLNMIKIPDISGDEGSVSEIILNSGERNIKKKGKVIRLLGDLDKSGRMAKILVSVEDPFDLKIKDFHKRNPLLLGSYVSVSIEGKKVYDVFKLPRTILKEDNTVWIADKNNKLSIKKIKVVWEYKDYILAKGLRKNDLIISSSIPAPIPGMVLRMDKN